MAEPAVQPGNHESIARMTRILFGNPDRSIDGTQLYLTDIGKKISKGHTFDGKSLSKFELFDQTYLESHGINQGKDSGHLFLKASNVDEAGVKETYHAIVNDGIQAQYAWGVRLLDDNGAFVDIPIEGLSTEKQKRQAVARSAVVPAAPPQAEPQDPAIHVEPTPPIVDSEPPLEPPEPIEPPESQPVPMPPVPVEAAPLIIPTPQNSTDARNILAQVAAGLAVRTGSGTPLPPSPVGPLPVEPTPAVEPLPVPAPVEPAPIPASVISSQPVRPEEPPKRPEGIVLTGAITKERRVEDLAHERFEKTAGWWKKSFQEVFEEKFRQFYDKAIDAAQTPFAKESIAKAETIARAKYEQELASMNGIKRSANKLWNWVKDKTFGETRIQQLTIAELRSTQDAALQELLTNERKAFAQELEKFSERFALQFDKSSDTLIQEGIVRSGMKENVLDADPATAQKIKAIIKKYYTNEGNATPEALESQLTGDLRSLFSELKTSNPGIFKKEAYLADNITIVAKDMKRQIETAANHEVGVSAIDQELAAMKVRLGIGFMGEATELKPTETRKVVQKINGAIEWMEKKNIVTGLVVNDAVAGTAVSAALALSVIPRSIVSRAARLWGGAAGGGVVTGVISGAREFGRRKGEFLRVAAQKETGIGAAVGGAKMREWYDRFDMKPRSVSDLMDGMTKGMYTENGILKDSITETDLRVASANLADAKARRIVSSRENNRIGLINIGAVGEQEANRTKLEQTIIKTERDLSAYITDHHTDEVVTRVIGSATDANAFISLLTNTQVRVLTEGSAVVSQVTTNPAVGVTLGEVRQYMPETEILRHKFLLWGKEESKGKAEGVDEILGEFKKQSIAESAKYGLYRGAVGVGIGAFANQAVMSLSGHGESGAIMAGLRTIGVSADPYPHALSDISTQSTMIGGHPTFLGTNLKIDPTNGGLDWTDSRGVVHDSIIPKFTDHVKFDAQGHITSMDPFATQQLEQNGLFAGIDHTDIASPPASDTHILSIDGKDYTAPKGLQFEFDATHKPNMVDVIYTVKDSSGNDVDIIVKENVPLHSSLLETVKSRPDLFTIHEASSSITPAGASIELPGHEILDSANDAHSPHWTLPQGYHYTSIGDNEFGVADGSNKVLAHVHIDDTGKITNFAEVQKDLNATSDHTQWSIHETTEKISGNQTVETPPSSMDEYRDIHFLKPEEMSSTSAGTDGEAFGIAHNEGGMWDFFKDRVETPQGNNAIKHAMRSWVHFYGDDGKDTNILSYDSIKGMESLSRGVPLHETTLGREVDWGALQNNAHLRLTNALFSDENIGRIDTLTNKAITDYAHSVGITATDHDQVMSELAKHFSQTGVDRDAIEASFGDDKAGYILFKMGYIGKEADLPTKEELDILMSSLRGGSDGSGGEQLKDIFIHNYEFTETTQGGGTILPTGNAISQNVFTVGEQVDSFIPILPPEFAQRLESVKTPQSFEARLSMPSSMYYGGESLESLRIWLQNNRSRLHPSRRIQNADGSVSWLNENNESIQRDVSRERTLLQSYIDRTKQNESEYFAQIEPLLNQPTLTPMENTCRVAINIPAYREGKNIYHVLDMYTKQIDDKGTPLDPKQYEINIVVNRKRGVSPDNSVQEIERFKTDAAAQGKLYHINYVDVEFDPPFNTVGNARKVITDLTVLRSLQRTGQSQCLYFESEDADLTHVDPYTVTNIIHQLDSNAYLDALRGMQDRMPEELMKNDYLFTMRRLWDFTEMMLRRKQYRPENNPNWHFTWNRVITGGWNTAFTAEAYALIDGYDRRQAKGEDMTLGEKITMVRGDGTMPNLEVVGKVGTRSDSSPRRFLNEIITGRGAYSEAFEDEALNDYIKTASLDDLQSKILPVSRINPSNETIFKNLLRGHWGAVKEMTPDVESAKELYDGLMIWMGIDKADYAFTVDGNVEITNLDHLRQALENYRLRHPNPRAQGERTRYSTT